MVKMKKRRKNNYGIIGVAIVVLVAIFEVYGGKIDAFFTTIKNGIKESLNIKEEIEPVINEVNSDLKVYFLDVGQADSILIQNKNENMLIDAGNNEDGPKLVKYFKKLGIKNFKYVVGTHPHEDHIGGLDNIINSFDVENIYLPNAITTTKTFEDVLDAIEKKNKSFETPKINDTFNLGEASLTVIFPGTNTNDLNSSSIVLKMTFGNNSFLFMGDAPVEVEDKILLNGISADVLKVGHHGSRYSSSDAFLDKVNCKYAIISCGKNNSYDHPHKETLAKLNTRNIKIYRTDEMGTILASSDGREIKMSIMKTNTNG